MTDPGRAAAPDDSGSDTYRRYRYQALVAFPFCLQCVLGEELVAVVPEHFEDLALEYRDGRWRLAQVKTRNPERGLWKLSDVLADDGGLRGLLRSYSAIPDALCTYELWLEGAVKPKDRIQVLAGPEPQQDAALVERIRTRFDLDAKVVKDFLSKFQLKANQPSRDAIAARNIRYLGRLAPDLPYAEVEAIHEKVVRKIEAAVAAELLGDDWPRIVVVAGRATPDATDKIAKKRLTADHLRPLLPSLVGPGGVLLKRVTDPGGVWPSVLEEKLLAGGASAEMIEAAKSLRAQATIRELEAASIGLWSSEDMLTDLRERLQHRVDAVRARFSGEPRPAPRIWQELTDVLARQANAIDPRRLLLQDADLLLGEVCQMADLCMTDWGVASA